jgi:hypothetical protein
VLDERKIDFSMRILRFVERKMEGTIISPTFSTGNEFSYLESILVSTYGL